MFVLQFWFMSHGRESEWFSYFCFLGIFVLIVCFTFWWSVQHQNFRTAMAEDMQVYMSDPIFLAFRRTLLKRRSCWIFRDSWKKQKGGVPFCNLTRESHKLSPWRKNQICWTLQPSPTATPEMSIPWLNQLKKAHPILHERCFHNNIPKWNKRVFGFEDF